MPKSKYAIVRRMVIPFQHHITDWSLVDATIFHITKHVTLVWPVCHTYALPFLHCRLADISYALYMYQLLMLLVNLSESVNLN